MHFDAFAIQPLFLEMHPSNRPRIYETKTRILIFLLTNIHNCDIISEQNK